MEKVLLASTVSKAPTQLLFYVICFIGVKLRQCMLSWEGIK